MYKVAFVILTDTPVSTSAIPPARVVRDISHSLIVAIDFGTTSSGYAYSHLTEGKIDIQVGECLTSFGGENVLKAELQLST